MKVATLCYIQHKGTVLMMHRNKRPNDLLRGFWDGVGGKVAEGESPEDCIIREVAEETGLTITNPELKGVITFPNNRGTGETWYVFVFVARRFTGKLAENYEGTLQWIRLSDLDSLRIQQADRYFVPWLERDDMFSAKFDYEGDDLRDHTVSFYPNGHAAA